MMNSGCSTFAKPKVSPSLLEDPEEHLPMLEKGDTNSILLWKLEADSTYAECRDGKRALIKAVQ